eukprot:PITA_24315
MPLIENEVKRMYDAQIIAPIKYSDWVSNLVTTRKKTGEIRFCVDFRNLNKVSLKDNYPLQKMDHILERVVGSSRISFIDRFSGYNQILVQPEDQEKTVFTTPWGTFIYLKMPFGLMDARATFQRVMDIAFDKEIHDFLVVYQDDITIFSKSDNKHLDHLRRVFIRCRKFSISLNPKKTRFVLEEEHTIAAILLQKNDQGYEQTIAFFSKSLRDATLKYNIMEKQALSLVKAIKYFIVYILYSHIIAYVPNSVVKDILTQIGPEGKRGKWIATILEFDIEINPRKLIKGQGLAKLMAESNRQALDINFISALDDQEEMENPQISEPFIDSPWYADIIFVLLNLQAPLGLSRTKARFLKMKSMKYCIIDNALFCKDNGGILLNYLLKDEADIVMQEFHARDCGGHLY